MAFEISVFLKNKITHFEDITNTLRQENINIRSLILSNINHGWGELNLLVDQPEKAYRILSNKQNSVVLREVIALEMKDETGGLDELLVKIARTGIHVENAYSRVIADNRTAILVIEVPDVIDAINRLKQNDIEILSDDLVYGR